MDLHILHKVGLKKKEKMSDNNDFISMLAIFDDTEDTETSIVMFILKLIVALFASYLSWTSSINYQTPLRVIFSFFAFMFGGLYIFLFLIFRSDIYDFSKLKLNVNKMLTK
jgi:hypothetical protein